MVSISNKQKCTMRILIILTLLLSTAACNRLLESTHDPVATSSATSSINTPEASMVWSSTETMTSVEIKQVCPDLRLITNGDVSIEGKLLYWDYPSLYALSLPDLEEVEYRNAKSSYISVSPKNNYFVTVNEGYDEQNLSIIPYLEVLDFSGQVISSTPWKEDWGEGSPIWVSDQEILIKTKQEKTLVIYNPFNGSTYNKTFHFPDENKFRIVTVDPLFKIVVYIYSTLDDGFGSWNSLRVWDEGNQREILDLKDKFSSIVSDIALSNDGKKTAITTVTPDEEENHSEIFIIDNEHGTYTQISNFRTYFDDILIPDTQWSLDGKEVYFWTINSRDARDATDLYSIELQTKEVTHYCFGGRQGFENSIVWVPDALGFYIITDSTSYSNPEGSSKDMWSVLLVDSTNKKAYKIAEDVSLMGWLTQMK